MKRKYNYRINYQYYFTNNVSAIKKAKEILMERVKVEKPHFFVKELSVGLEVSLKNDKIIIYKI